MRKFYLIFIWLGFATVVFLLYGQACSTKNFSSIKLAESDTLMAQGCSTINAEDYYRFLFIVDISGSNQSTDPDKSRRLTAIHHFVQKYSDDQRIRWGLIAFAGQVSSPRIFNLTEKSPGFFLNYQDFQASMNSFNRLPDSGGTPFLLTMREISRVIRGQLEIPQENSLKDRLHFQLIFISDGAPYPANENSISAIEQEILSWKTITPNVYFHTVYYDARDQHDPRAIEIMQRLANVGGGQFRDNSRAHFINLDLLFLREQCQ